MLRQSLLIHDPPQSFVPLNGSHDCSAVAGADAARHRRRVQWLSRRPRPNRETTAKTDKLQFTAALNTQLIGPKAKAPGNKTETALDNTSICLFFFFLSTPPGPPFQIRIRLCGYFTLLDTIRSRRLFSCCSSFSRQGASLLALPPLRRSGPPDLG